MDVGVDWNRIQPFPLQVMGLNTARGWEAGELLALGSCLGLNDVNWWWETLHRNCDSRQGSTAQPALPHTHGGADTVLQNVVPGDFSADKGMFSHSRKTLDGWLIPALQEYMRNIWGMVPIWWGCSHTQHQSLNCHLQWGWEKPAVPQSEQWLCFC